jgi:hypothetical protein
MSDLPAHPETGSAADTGPASEDPIGGWSRRRRALVIAAVIGLVVLVAVLHLAGVVGGESH